MRRDKVNRLIILGAGGHGRVVGDCARAIGRYNAIAFCDRQWPNFVSCMSWPIVGSDIAEVAEMGNEVFVALGNARLRVEALQTLQRSPYRVATIIHPHAYVSADSVVREGSIVVAGAVVNIGSKVGRGAIVNTGATLDHDCEIGDGVHLCPGAHVAGNVIIGPESWIGIGSAVRQGVRIGAGVIVGAGAVVVSDVPDGLTVVGVPAKPLAPNGSI